MKHSLESDLFRLGHIIECIDKITFLVEHCNDLQNFETKWIEQDAMFRSFEIIGEASNHISKETKTNYPIVEWHKLRGLRNIMPHEYFGVRLETIWQSAIEDIPKLKEQISKIIIDIKK